MIPIPDTHETRTGTEYHIGLGRGDISEFVILTGDPGRVEWLASFLDDAAETATNREYVSWRGTYHGLDLSIVSTGIGCPSAAIALEELVRIGAHTFIHIGTAGALQSTIHPGDCCISTAAVRQDGTTAQYLPLDYPAVAHFETTMALVTAAKAQGVPYHVGLTQTKDAFFTEGFVDLPDEAANERNWSVLQRVGVLSTSMESSALFLLGTIRRVRVGEVLAIIGATHENNPTGGAAMKKAALAAAMRIALAACEALVRDTDAKPEGATE